MSPNFGGVVYSPVGGGPTLWIASSAAPEADIKISASLYQHSSDSTGHNAGVAARVKADGSGGYVGIFNLDTDRYEIYRIVGGVASVKLASSATTYTYTNTTTTPITLSVTGTGATVNIVMQANGVDVVTFADTAAARVTTAERYGIWLYNNAGNGLFINSMTAESISSAGAAVTFSLSGASAVDGFIFQRSGATGTVSLTCEFTGVPASVQARLVNAGTSTPVAGHDWSTKIASPSGSSGVLNFANVPQGGFYQVQIRDSADTAAITTPGNQFGVGVRIALIGQSNIEALSMLGTGTPNAKLRVYDRYRSPGQWLAPTTGAGAIELGNALVAALGGNIPVGLIQYAVSGAGLQSGSGVATATSGNTARYWLDETAAAGIPWHDFSTAMALIGPDVELIVYGQGESDAQTGVGVSTYGTALTTLIGKLRTLLGANKPVILPLLGQTNHPGTTAANWDTVRQAQIATAAALTGVSPVSKHDLACDAGSPDMSAANFVIWGQRLGQKLAHALGLVSYGDGPSISSVATVSSTVYDINLTHRGGTDITPVSPTTITGLQFKDGSTVITPSTVVRQSASVIRATLATAPTGAVTVQSAFGKTPTGAVAKDNSAFALPLMASAPVAAAASTARTVTLTMRDDTGPAANLTGMKVSLRLGTGPHDSGAVLYQSATETTDASGVMTFSFNSADISAGGSALLDVITSDGRNLCRVVTVA